jgi:hypothetical protein
MCPFHPEPPIFMANKPGGRYPCCGGHVQRSGTSNSQQLGAGGTGPQVGEGGVLISSALSTTARQATCRCNKVHVAAWVLRPVAHPAGTAAVCNLGTALLAWDGTSTGLHTYVTQ